DINGIPLKLIDTAGIRSTDENIERMGIDLSRKKSQEAEFVIAVLDGSQDLSKDDEAVLKLIGSHSYIVVLNKNDLGIKISVDDLPSDINKDHILDISAKNNINIDRLRRKIFNIITGNRKQSEQTSIIISELRHKNSLELALDSLK
ncbi:MAG: tRNA uridine-5-carboxymethylaminomethyl(34) synthesis GTPase MnmE, partial [Candidatus Dadabacteria bacterium]|nr:tRNA uridine-5-carboxymethylaminomethyl(34) synthesis GTPase MnmE [Candidatus Dadabacteria bacterium]